MISVIIPARNEEYLQQTVDSLLEGAEGEVEIIVVLDGYWPNPPLKDDKRVVILHHTIARGMQGCVNEAARIAKGKYLL